MPNIPVVNNGAGSYVIDGKSNPSLSFIRGNNYILEISAPGHPFWIQTVSGQYNSANVYNSGITNNGRDVGNISFRVPNDAPNTLYYVCQYHTSMQGTIIITDPPPETPVIAKHIFSMGSLYSNNAQVYYKAHSLSSGSGGSGVGNYRIKQRRT